MTKGINLQRTVTETEVRQCVEVKRKANEGSVKVRDQGNIKAALLEKHSQ
jgi:hypothetical protein